jgi:hypothetical protein
MCVCIFSRLPKHLRVFIALQQQPSRSVYTYLRQSVSLSLLKRFERIDQDHHRYIMAIEQQPTLQQAEDAIKSGNNAEGERILKQIMDEKNGKSDELFP